MIANVATDECKEFSALAGFWTLLRTGTSALRGQQQVGIVNNSITFGSLQGEAA